MLTPKQQRFVDEYMIDSNATQAAIRAGYSEDTARQMGAENLTKPDIAAAVDEARNAQSERTRISADRVIEEIEALALWDPAALVEVMVETPPGSGKFVVEGITEPASIKLLPEKVRRAIVGWSWDRGGNFTLKLADKSKALDQLMRHLGEYNDKLDINPMDGLADRMERAKARAIEHEREEREGTEAAIQRRVNEEVQRIMAQQDDEPEASPMDGLAARLARARIEALPED